MHGGRIAYYRGDVKLIMEDLANVKPMGFPSVPRLLNRVYDKVNISILICFQHAVRKNRT